MTGSMIVHSLSHQPRPRSPSPMALPDTGQDYDQQQQQEQRIQEHMKRVNSSLNVLSFGFLATAVLISVFLVVALLERFLQHPRFQQSGPPSPLPDAPSVGPSSQSIQDSGIFLPEKRCLMGVSVLMPGQSVPTFIASPAPILYEAEDAGESDGRRNLWTQSGHQEV